MSYHLPTCFSLIFPNTLPVCLYYGKKFKGWKLPWLISKNSNVSGKGRLSENETYSVRLSRTLFFLWRRAFPRNVEIVWDQSLQLPAFELFALSPRPPREARCEGTNLDVRGVLLHAWWLGRKIFALCIENDRLSGAALICIFPVKDAAFIWDRRLFESGAYFKDG